MRFSDGNEQVFNEWYADNKWMLWGMHFIIGCIIFISAIDGKFILALWQFLAYVWFIRAMEGHYLAFRALKLLDSVLKVN